MDPDENARQQRETARDLVALIDKHTSDDGQFDEGSVDELVDLASQLADLVLAFDDWAVKGGAMPKRWRKGQRG